VNLYAKLTERDAAGHPIRIGLVGAGKFGTMFLTQVRRTPGMHLVGLADLDVSRARGASLDRRDGRSPRTTCRTWVRSGEQST
jgi:predicted homoserine dehydrogenase-like protein